MIFRFRRTFYTVLFNHEITRYTAMFQLALKN